MYLKAKRQKKPSQPMEEEKLENISVKEPKLTIEKIKENFQQALVENFEKSRKKFPSYSIMNPLLLNKIR